MHALRLIKCANVVLVHNDGYKIKRSDPFSGLIL